MKYESINTDPKPKKKSRFETLSKKFETTTKRDERRYVHAEKKIKNGGIKAEKKYGYNYQAAQEQGIEPDSTGHYPSIGEGGMILKGRKHPTAYKTKKIERSLGNKVFKVKGGTMFSLPKENKEEIKATKWIYKQRIRQ